jgi:hypothetical protein
MKEKILELLSKFPWKKLFDWLSSDDDSEEESESDD